METADTGHGLSVWLERAAMIERLGCTGRTLQRKVRRGEVERRQDGRRNLYRLRPQKQTVYQTQNADIGQERTRTSDSGSLSDVSDKADPYAAITALVAMVGEVREELRITRQELLTAKEERDALRELLETQLGERTEPDSRLEALEEAVLILKRSASSRPGRRLVASSGPPERPKRRKRRSR